MLNILLTELSVLIDEENEDLFAMNFIISGILECISIAKRNSRVVFYFFAIYLGLLFCGNTSTPDRSAYALVYHHITKLELNGSNEIGFQILMLIGKKLGISFYVFCGVICIISLTLLANAILRLTVNPALALCSYFLFPFVLNGEQMRSFLGMSIVFQGITFVLEKRKYCWFIYFLLCVVGGLFHTSCFIYIIYLSIIIPRKMIKWIAVGVIAMFSIFRKRLNIIVKFIMGSFARKFDSYLGEIHSKNNWIIYVVFYALIIVITLYYYRKFADKIPNQKRHIDFKAIYKINIVSIGLLILIYLNPNMERILELVLIMDYCVLSNLVGKKIKFFREIGIIFFLIAIPGTRFIAYVHGSGWNNYIVPYFIEGFGSRM